MAHALYHKRAGNVGASLRSFRRWHDRGIVLILAAGGSGMTVEEALREERLGSLPLPAPVCVSRGTSLKETLRLMREEGAGCVLVCDADRPVGIFTERDVLNKLIGSG